MVSLQIDMLGGFEMRLASGAPLEFGQRKAQAILAYLSLAPDYAVPRARLVNLLWSERGEEQARSSLRQALAALKKGLREAEQMPFESGRETVALLGAHVAVDAFEFERLAESDDTADLEAAAALYRGDLLDGFEIAEMPFQEWLDLERTRFREMALTVLHALTARYEALGDFERAIEAARRAIGFDPLRESAHRTLMRLFVASGQGELALRQYESCRDLLQRELAVRPDVETERLYDEIRAQRGAPPPSATASESVSVTPANGAAMALPEKPSIAVLPFKNLSGPEDGYFADGIAEDILTALSKFHWFFVIARDSSFLYRDTDGDEQQVGSELGVRYVLTGSVRRAGARVRIAARLTDGPGGHHMWAENYDRDLEDVFQVQDEITERIVTAVAPQFLHAEMQRAERRNVQDLDAWGYVVRAHAHLSRLNKGDNDEARGLLDKAVARDPDSAWGYTGLAISHTQDALWGWSDSRVQSIMAAQQNAQRAIALDEGDAQAHAVIGLVRLVSRQHDAAIQTLERAIELNPNLANAHASLGLALAFCGQSDSAVAAVKLAMRLSPRDPLHVFWFNTLSLAAFVAGRYGEAAEWAEKTVQVNAEYAGGYRILAASYGQLGEAGQARDALKRLLQLSPGMTLGATKAQLPFKAEEDMARFLGGLSAAGLTD